MGGLLSPIEKGPSGWDAKKNDDGNYGKSDGTRSPESAESLDFADTRRRPKHTLPLSMQLMKPFAGLMVCPDCGRGTHSWPPRCMIAESSTPSDVTDSIQDDMTSLSKRYDDLFSQAPKRTTPTTVSPMVVAPMMHSPSNTQKLEHIMEDYRVACQFYGCPLNPGVLAALRFSMPALRVSGEFHDVDMLALVELMLKHGNSSLAFIRRLDFTVASKEGRRHGRNKLGFRSHGAFALAKVLQQNDHIEQVWMPRNRVGPYGASAIFLAASENKVLKVLDMRRCRIMERGGMAFAEIICSSRHCSLKDVNLSANFIGLRGSMAIEQAMAKRDEAVSDLMLVDLEGNLVFQEIMNGMTHGLGVLLGVVGGILLSNRVRDKPPRYIVSSAVYSASLLLLYISSTLFHSFFSLQNTRYIFEVLDKCAIYILIAGSYTPFLVIVFDYNPLYSTHLLAFIWTCCVMGIFVEFFHPTWKHKQYFSLGMYLGMGWASLMIIPEAMTLVSSKGVNFVFLGGVAYTSGVPFFVRNNNLDHSIWHCFVLVGSMFHWSCIYQHIVTREFSHVA